MMTRRSRTKRRLALRIGCAAFVWLWGMAPAVAQDASELEEVPVARTARSSVGQVGQRQTRQEVAPAVDQMGRINNRVPSRVQSRIRNRIDRFYDPRANAESPFAIASDQARTTGKPRRR